MKHVSACSFWRWFRIWSFVWVLPEFCRRKPGNTWNIITEKQRFFRLLSHFDPNPDRFTKIRDDSFVQTLMRYNLHSFYFSEHHITWSKTGSNCSQVAKRKFRFSEKLEFLTNNIALLRYMVRACLNQHCKLFRMRRCAKKTDEIWLSYRKIKNVTQLHNIFGPTLIKMWITRSN